MGPRQEGKRLTTIRRSVELGLTAEVALQRERRPKPPSEACLVTCPSRPRAIGAPTTDPMGGVEAIGPRTPGLHDANNGRASEGALNQSMQTKSPPAPSG
jgi:hypothetical protein